MLVAKRAFYDRICAGAQNAIAFDIINRLVLRTSVLRRRSLQRRERQAQSIKEIDLLLAAIARRDIVAAREAALTNVANSARSALFADLDP
jgi:DNA-binding GntR family transcriptional regulator